jgi:hypothetical protein
MLKKILTKYKSFSGTEFSLIFKKKVLNFFAMEFVYLFNQKNKVKKTKSLFSRVTRYCVCDGLELVIGTWK